MDGPGDRFEAPDAAGRASESLAAPTSPARETTMAGASSIRGAVVLDCPGNIGPDAAKGQPVVFQVS
jgi:hypothetical protein